MATHSSIVTWRIPWMEKPGSLQSTGSQRVGRDWATDTHNVPMLLSRFVPLLPLLCPQVCCLYLCLYCCPANRFSCTIFLDSIYMHAAATAAAKLLQLCRTLCDPIDGSPPGSPAPGILQARTLEWVAISFSNAWKWKVKVKSLSCVWPSGIPWTAAYQAAPSMEFSRQEYWSGVPLPSPWVDYTYLIPFNTQANLLNDYSNILPSNSEWVFLYLHIITSTGHCLNFLSFILLLSTQNHVSL